MGEGKDATPAHTWVPTELAKGSRWCLQPHQRHYFFNQYFPFFLPFPQNQKSTDYPETPTSRLSLPGKNHKGYLKIKRRTPQ